MTIIINIDVIKRFSKLSNLQFITPVKSTTPIVSGPRKVPQRTREIIARSTSMS